MKNKASVVVTVIIIIIVLVVVGGVSWYVVSQKQSSPPPGTEDQFKDWKTYRNEKYGFEFKYPQSWDYTPVEIQSETIIFAPQEIINRIKESLKNIKNDKDFSIMINFYEDWFFKNAILPYRGQSTEYIQNIPSTINIDGIEGKYYTTEFIKDHLGYKKGEKTVTIDLSIRESYLTIDLFDYQLLDMLNKILKTFKIID